MHPRVSWPSEDLRRTSPLYCDTACRFEGAHRVLSYWPHFLPASLWLGTFTAVQPHGFHCFTVLDYIVLNFT